MPRKSLELEVIAAIREYLKEAVKGSEPITDVRLIKVVGRARATFYKYVTEGSQIEQEIKQARIKQGEESDGGTIAKLRKDLDQAQEGNRELEAFIVRMTSNLLESGVSPAVIQAAQNGAMSKPDRSVNRLGRSRGRKRHKW